MKNGTQGFTLIELLIVIAIIGILAAVLIPNLLGARARANDTVAKAYLSDSVKAQEIKHIDDATYGSTVALLTAKGLKAAPAETTLAVVAASTTGYCMSSTHAGGSGKTFYATASTGITETQCTAAN